MPVCAPVVFIQVGTKRNQVNGSGDFNRVFRVLCRDSKDQSRRSGTRQRPLPAALSGSHYKAPGFAGGYLLNVLIQNGFFGAA
jgi:hypothetical protein